MKSKLILVGSVVTVLLLLVACSPASKEVSVEIGCSDFMKNHHISKQVEVRVDGLLTVTPKFKKGGSY